MLFYTAVVYKNREFTDRRTSLKKLLNKKINRET